MEGLLPTWWPMGSQELQSYEKETTGQKSADFLFTDWVRV
jgi:hypothetical protein